MTRDFLKTNAVQVFVLLFFAMLLFSLPESSSDAFWWVNWAAAIRQHGFSSIYAQQEIVVNYLPLPLIGIFVWEQIIALLKVPLNFETAYTLKFLPIFFDALSVLLAVRLAKKYKVPPVAVLVGLLFNVAFLYNSYIWGQIDSVHTFFVFLALFLLSKKRNFWGFVSYLVALNFKIQAMVFLPVILMYLVINLLSAERLTFKWKNSAFGLFCLAVLQGAAFLPFSSSPAEIFRLVWKEGVNQSIYLSWNAYNLWYLILPSSPDLNHSMTWMLGFSYQNWGYGLFFLSSGVVLFPLFLIMVKAFRARFVHSNHQLISALKSWLESRESWLLFSVTSYLVVLNSFYFLTGMHERYAHPTVLMAFLVGIFSKNYRILLLTSIAYVLNLNTVMRFWGEPMLLSENAPQISAILYLIAMGMALFVLYKSSRKSLAWLHDGKKVSPSYENT